MPTTHWNAFYPISSALKSDEPGLDPGWAAAMGVDKDALAVLRVVRREVLPLIRNLERRGVLRTSFFLVHDRASGVPCPSEDSRAFVHLRLECYDPASGDRAYSWKPGMKKYDVRDALKGWAYVQKVRLTKAEQATQEVLRAQSAWYLKLVEDARDLSDSDLLQHICQTLHYFANMAQMMVR